MFGGDIVGGLLSYMHGMVVCLLVTCQWALVLPHCTGLRLVWDVWNDVDDSM